MTSSDRSPALRCSHILSTRAIRLGSAAGLIRAAAWSSPGWAFAWAGAVAVAGRYSGVYPQASPGGWQLLGHTDLAVWDLDREPPALLVPGARVRFEAAG